MTRRRATPAADWFAGFMREVPCPSCGGARLKPVSLAVTVDGRSIGELCALPIGELATTLPALKLSQRDAADLGPDPG